MTTEIRQDFRASEYRSPVRAGVVTSVPKYLGYPDDPIQDELILVDGWQIGSTYHCANGTWASFGPAGLSRRHPTRQAATDAQVHAYLIDPDGYERIVADELIEEAAEDARRNAEVQAERARRDEERRRARLGDDEPGPTILTVPAYHALYAPSDETQQVADWLRSNGVEGASGVHEIRVEQRTARQVIVFEVPVARSVRTTWDTPTETHVATLTVDPPVIATPARPDLHDRLNEHWPTTFPMIELRTLACGPCTRAAGSRTSVVAWQCETVAKAIANPPVEAQP